MDTLPQLEERLRQAGADFELIRQQAPILSAEDARPYYDVAKAAPTFILETENGLIACVLSAQRGKMDFETMKSRFGFARLKLADRKKVEKQTGYRVGTLPPVGHGLDCIFDSLLLQHDYVYGGTGDAFVTLKIRPGDIKALNRVIGEL